MPPWVRVLREGMVAMGDTLSECRTPPAPPLTWGVYATIRGRFGLQFTYTTEQSGRVYRSEPILILVQGDHGF